METSGTSNKNSLKVSWLEATQQFKGKKPIDFLYERLHLLYPKRWESQFDSLEHLEAWKECWGEELDERQVTFEEVKKGLAKCIEIYNWPPSFPEFLKACRPPLDYEAAYHEAIKQMHLRAEGKDEWSNPAIFHAAARIGNDMGNGYDFIKTRWKTELDKAIYDVSAGHLSKVIEKRVKPSALLNAPRREGKYSEVALTELAKITEILNTEPAWKKALREKGKDTSSPKTGLRPMSDFVHNLTKSKEEVV